MKKEELIKILEDTYRERISTTIIEEDKPTINDLHPTMKPIKLLSRLIKNSSRVDECVLDLFGGSGSTLIACEQLSRTCYMMELDPKYCDVIIKRWETLTGKKAELEKSNGGGWLELTTKKTESIKTDYLNGMTYKDIFEKYNITLSDLKKIINKNKLTRSKSELLKGNQNAKNNKGGKGAAANNKNAVTTGEYEKLFAEIGRASCRERV